MCVLKSIFQYTFKSTDLKKKMNIKSNKICPRSTLQVIIQKRRFMITKFPTRNRVEDFFRRGWNNTVTITLKNLLIKKGINNYFDHCLRYLQSAFIIHVK